MDFFREFQILRDKTPRIALRNSQSVNSEYCNFAISNKNSYLLTGAAFNEDCYYGTTVIKCRDCIDVYNVTNCELCYECLDTDDSYNSSFLQNCKNVRDSWLCYDGINLEYCFGCVSQRNKKYCLFNEQLAKETYEEKIRYFLSPKGLPEAREKFETLKQQLPHVYARIISSEHCIGDFITNSKDCFMCFDAKDSQDCLYQDRPMGAKDCVDCSFLHQNNELNYMTVSTNSAANCNFCFIMDFSHDCEYCLYCFNSHHLFGCVSRNHAEYEILNAKYSPDAWHKKVVEIKEGMKREGSYGTMLRSDFPYEDSIAREYFRS